MSEFGPALGPTQPPVQWLPAVLSPRVKRGRGVTVNMRAMCVCVVGLLTLTGSYGKCRGWATPCRLHNSCGVQCPTSDRSRCSGELRQLQDIDFWRYFSQLCRSDIAVCTAMFICQQDTYSDVAMGSGQMFA
jgi:hypothetical protein